MLDSFSIPLSIPSTLYSTSFISSSLSCRGIGKWHNESTYPTSKVEGIHHRERSDKREHSNPTDKNPINDQLTLNGKKVKASVEVKVKVLAKIERKVKVICESES